jgi:hypothetical protein
MMTEAKKLEQEKIKAEQRRLKRRAYERDLYARHKGGVVGKAGRPANTAEVLWAKVNKKGEDECWEWLGYKNEQGYGRTEINDKSYYAHRVIFDLVNPGKINLNAPKSVHEYGFIMHSCDNPSCCNPKHLSIGNHADNMADKVAKGRQNLFPSDTGPRCKLTMEQARQARQLRKDGMSVMNLAKQFGISLPSMKTLLRGESYKET